MSDSSSKRNGVKDKCTLSVPYVDRSEKFIIKFREYKQYHYLYSYRLNKMTTLLKNKIEQNWGTKFPIKKLCDLREDDGDKCIIIGTLYKNQRLKPSILREIAEELEITPQPHESNRYWSDDDILILEDELQRIRLNGDEILDLRYIVTGVTCAVLGFVETHGQFNVEDVLFYESGPQKSLTPLNISPLVVFASGIDQLTPKNITMSVELFQQWLLGNADGYRKNPNLNPFNVVRIVIAGNSVRSQKPVKLKTLQTRKSEVPDACQAFEMLDRLLKELSEIAPLDLMPGDYDPSTYFLPQQPFHPLLFDKAKSTNNFKSVTNPYGFEIAERYILGTSSKNIKDVLSYSQIEDPIDALRSTLIWSNISPTCPDTIGCHPYVEFDPFIIEEFPHIYFVGNQPEFKTELYTVDNKKCRLVCIPSFVKTESIAVVDLNTLECHELNFTIPETEE